MFKRPGGRIRVGLCVSALVASCALAGSAHAQTVDGTCDQVSPNAATCRTSDAPTACGRLRAGTPNAGKSRKNSGRSMVAPLMPANTATEAMTTHAGSMNQ